MPPSRKCTMLDRCTPISPTRKTSYDCKHGKCSLPPADSYVWRVSVTCIYMWSNIHTNSCLATRTCLQGSPPQPAHKGQRGYQQQYSPRYPNCSTRKAHQRLPPATDKTLPALARNPVTQPILLLLPNRTCVQSPSQVFLAL